MRPLKVDDNGYESYSYDGTRIRFGLVAKKDKKRVQIKSLSDCRDYINDFIIESVDKVLRNNENKDKYYFRSIGIPADLKKLRLLIQKQPNSEDYEEVKQSLLDAKRIINMYEELGKFSSRSVLASVEHTIHKNVWLLTGPEEWMKSSHLVSMVTLIFRIVSNNSEEFRGLNTLDQVEKKFLSIRHSYDTDLVKYLPASWPKFRMYMEEYDTLFRSKSFDFWNPADCIHEWHSSGGIYSLSTFSTNNKNINDLVKETWEKWSKNKVGSLTV